MVHALLKAPQALLGPLRLPAKFGLVTLMFFVSALVPAAFMVASQNRELNHLALERRGVTFLNALYGLTEHVAQARLAGQNQLDGGARAEDNGLSMEGLEFAVEADLAALKALDAPFGAELKTRLPVRGLAEAWSKVLEAREPQAHLAALAGFTEDLLALNASVVDTSGLIVDADMASFYVIDTCTLELPRQAEGLIGLSSAAQAAATGGPLSDLGREELQRQVGAIRSQLDAIKGMLSDSKGFSRPEVAGPLGVRLAAHLKVTEAFLAQVGAGVLGPRSLASKPALRYAGRQALQSTFDLQSAALRVLENLLTMRIRHLRSEQRLGLGGALCASLLAFALLAALYRGLKHGLGQLEAGLKGLRTGELTLEAQVPTRDEVGVLAEDLNQALAALRELAGALRTGTQVLQEASVEAAALGARLTASTAGQAASLDEAADRVATLATAADHTGQRTLDAGEEAQRVGEGLRRCRQADLNATQAIAALKASAAQGDKLADGLEGLAFEIKRLAVSALQLAEHGKPERDLSQLASELHALGRRGAMASGDLKALVRDKAALLAAGGSDLAGAGDALQRLAGDLAALTTQLQEVGDAARGQTRRLADLGELLARLGAGTGEHASHLRQVEACLETLASQARSLAGLAGRFTP